MLNQAENKVSFTRAAPGAGEREKPNSCHYELSSRAERGIRVSLVITDETARMLLSTLIADTPGLQLVSAHASAASAVVQLRKLKPQAVLIDVAVPDISAFECTRGLKNTLPKLSVIILAARHLAATVLPSLAAGADGWLLKDPGLRNIPAAIFELFQTGAVISPEAVPILRKALQLSSFRDDPSHPLTSREKDVAILRNLGLRRKDIAIALGIEEGTVRAHLRNIRRKHLA